MVRLNEGQVADLSIGTGVGRWSRLPDPEPVYPPGSVWRDAVGHVHVRRVLGAEWGSVADGWLTTCGTQVAFVAPVRPLTRLVPAGAGGGGEAGESAARSPHVLRGGTFHRVHGRGDVYAASPQDRVVGVVNVGDRVVGGGREWRVTGVEVASGHAGQTLGYALRVSPVESEHGAAFPFRAAVITDALASMPAVSDFIEEGTGMDVCDVARVLVAVQSWLRAWADGVVS